MFEKSTFERSLVLLNKIDYELFHFKIDLKNLQLKLYYELGYYEEMRSAIDTYRHFIMNNKYISVRYKAICTGFVNNISVLMKVKLKEEKSNYLQLEKDILTSENIIFREWFVQKISEFRT